MSSINVEMHVVLIRIICESFYKSISICFDDTNLVKQNK